MLQRRGMVRSNPVEAIFQKHHIPIMARDSDTMSGMDGDILGTAEKDPFQHEKSVRERFWTVFGRAASQIPFAEDLVAAWYCALDANTPRRTKAILLGALAYFIMPFDTVPDFLAIIGFSDDVAVLGMAIAAIRSNLTDAHRAAARKALADFAGKSD